MTMLETASSAFPIRPHHENEKKKCENIQAELHGTGDPVAQQAVEDRFVEPPVRAQAVGVLVVPVEHQGGVKPAHQRPTGNGGDGRSGDPHLREPEAAVDQHVVQWDVEQHADGVDHHDRPGHAPADEKGGQRRLRHMEHRAGAQDSEIDRLQPLDFGRVAAPGKNRFREQGKADKHPARQQGEVHELPQRRPDLPVGAGTLVLGDENAAVAGHSREKGDKQKGDHARGRGRGDGIQAVIGKKHPVGEFHHRDGRHADDQRKADPHHLGVPVFSGPVAAHLHDRRSIGWSRRRTGACAAAGHCFLRQPPWKHKEGLAWGCCLPVTGRVGAEHHMRQGFKFVVSS